MYAAAIERTVNRDSLSGVLQILCYISGLKLNAAAHSLGAEIV